MQNRYLPNLNGLRAISVVLVILGHATSMQLYFGGYQFKDWLWIPTKVGVAMFFCISGILISYLLDEERKRTGDINVKQFYVRRAARIWPLYFLVVLPAIPLNLFFAAPSFHTNMIWLDYVLLAFILPGFANMPQFVGPTWSIGIEESFYAVYPLMVRYLSKQSLAALLLAVVFSNEIFAVIGQYACPGSLCTPRLWWAPEWYGCIAIGCLTYMIYSEKSETINRFLFSAGLQCAAFSALAVALSAGVFAERYFSYRLQTVALAVIAINAAVNPNSILQIENKMTKAIGEISYGMYMFHVYCICLALMLCWVFFKGETFPLQNLIVSTLSLVLTVIVSKLSYDHFESPLRRWAREPSAPPNPCR
jgi:peptidoglycan/LPS O-acetylase OafA/YrhL